MRRARDPLPPDTLAITIPREGEIRLCVPFDETTAKISVLKADEMVNPKAEVFGAPLLPHNHYAVPPGRVFPVFSWSGGILHVHGSQQFRLSVYRASTTNYKALAEYHCVLHAARDAAQRSQVLSKRMGPRVVICGAAGSGKHSAMRTMANYAARFGWCPTVVDCSVATQSLAVPGAIGAAVWEYPATLDEDTANHLTIAYHCGLLAPQAAVETKGAMQFPVSPIYVKVVDSALSVTRQRLQAHANDVSGWSGCFVLLPDLIYREGIDFVRHVIDAIDATHVLCIGDEYMFAHLQEAFVAPQGVAFKYITNTQHELHLERLAVGSGPVRMNERQMKEWRSRQCSKYFLGAAARLVQPRHMRKSHKWAEIFQFVEKAGKCVVERCSTEDLILRHRLQNVVAALYDLPAGHGEVALLSLPVVAYVHIRDVDVKDISLWSSIGEAGLPQRPALVLSKVMWLQ